MTFDQLLEEAIKKEASDLLLAPGAPPALRVDGVLGFAAAEPLAPDAPRHEVARLLSPEQQQRLASQTSVDFPLERQGRRFRGSAWLTGGQIGLALRLLPGQIAVPEKLGLPPILSELVLRPQGLIVLTGATGQGKSTTQASLIDLLNRTGPRLVVTLEDPIEYVHPRGKAVIDQRELGRDIRSFGEALKHLVRQRPDVVMLGEMRDEDSIRGTLTLAETGHLVLSTMHTGDAVQTIGRMIEGFPPAQQALIRSQLAAVLLAVVNQRLVHGLKGKLVLAAEVLINTPAVAKLIRDGHPEQIYGLMELEQHAGSRTLNHALEHLVRTERIAPREADHYASSHESRTELPKGRKAKG